MNQRLVQQIERLNRKTETQQQELQSYQESSESDRIAVQNLEIQAEERLSKVKFEHE